jgi:hypothetical protein
MNGDTAKLILEMYAKNHKDLGDFPYFACQFEKVQGYLKDHPEDSRRRVYFAHLLKEIGAAPLAIEECGKALAQNPEEKSLLFSIRVIFKECRQPELIGKYPLLNRKDVEEMDFVLEGERRIRFGTDGEIEYTAGKLGQQDW